MGATMVSTMLSMFGSAPPDTSVPLGEVIDSVSTREAVDLLFTRPAVAIGVLLLTWIVTRIARGVLRRMVRRVADRSVFQSAARSGASGCSASSARRPSWPRSAAASASTRSAGWPVTCSRCWPGSWRSSSCCTSCRST